MAVIEELDEKIRFYHEKLEEAKELRKETERLNAEIIKNEDKIKSEYRQISKLKKEEILAIKLGDLIKQIAWILDVDEKELETKLTVKSSIYDKTEDTLPRYLFEEDTLFPSYLNIKQKEGKSILNEEVFIFSNLGEIENDGKSLLSHCDFVQGCGTSYSLVINENIDDIICHFKLETIDYENYKNYLLPDAIRGCIEKQEGKQYAKKR